MDHVHIYYSIFTCIYTYSICTYDYVYDYVHVSLIHFSNSIAYTYLISLMFTPLQFCCTYRLLIILMYMYVKYLE